MEKKELRFNFEESQAEGLEFQILLMVHLLANENLAYRGTLKEINDALGYNGRDTRRNRRIKEAINKLEEKGLIKTIYDGSGRGQIITLTLSKRAGQFEIIRVQTKWIKQIKEILSKEGHVSVNWITVLRVLLVVIYYAVERGYAFAPEPIPYSMSHEIFTNSIIGNHLNISASTVSKCMRVIREADIIKTFRVFDDRIEDKWICLGTKVVSIKHY